MDSKTDTHIKTLIINYHGLAYLSVCHHTAAYLSVQQHTPAYEKRCRGSGEAPGRSCVAALRLYIKQYMNLIFFPPILLSLWRTCVTDLRLYIKQYINLIFSPLYFLVLDGLASLLSVCIESNILILFFFPLYFLSPGRLCAAALRLHTLINILRNIYINIWSNTLMFYIYIPVKKALLRRY